MTVAAIDAVHLAKAPKGSHMGLAIRQPQGTAPQALRSSAKMGHGVTVPPSGLVVVGSWPWMPSSRLH